MQIPAPRKEISLKGVLFSALHRQHHSDYSGLSPHHQRQSWLPLSQLPLLAKTANLPQQQWAIVDKKDWLSPLSTDDINPLTFEEICERLQEYFRKTLRPLQLVCLQGPFDDAGQASREKRYFVTDDSWPALPASAAIK